MKLGIAIILGRILRKYINNECIPVELFSMSDKPMLLSVGNIFDGALRRTTSLNRNL